MKKAVFLFAVVAVLAMALPASAQIGKVGVGAHLSTTDSAVEEDEREFVFGVQARARISDMLAIEGSMEFREEDLIDDATLSIYPIQFSALFYLLPQSKVSIYGLVGMGLTRTSVSGDLFGEDVSSTDMSYHWGGGVEVPVSDIMGIYGDIRYLEMDFDLEALSDFDLNTSGWQMNFGVNWYF